MFGHVSPVLNGGHVTDIIQKANIRHFKRWMGRREAARDPGEKRAPVHTVGYEIFVDPRFWSDT
jgi:hypothetical protein